jgi:hypothetical protein
MRFKKPLIFVVLTVFYGLCSASALGDLAASMNAGDWRELTTQNIGNVLSNTRGASNTVFGYPEDIKWDPNTQSLYYMGSDHFYSSGGYPRFVQYAESTNEWRELTRPSWFPFCASGAMHGYDHNAINPATGDMYHSPFGRSVIQKYSAGQKSWSTLPGTPTGIRHCGGLEYIPDMGGLLFAQAGYLFHYNESSGQWQTLKSGLTMGGCHCFAEYNPVHKVTVFGGGEGSGTSYPNLYKVDTLGTVTTQTSAPFSLGPNHAIVTVDPVSGDYLVFHKSKQFYKYDVTTDTWTQMPGSVPIYIDHHNTTNHLHGVVATPVATHGVTLFVSVRSTTKRAVNIYKHAESSPSVGRHASADACLNGGIKVSPNPFHVSTNLKVEGLQKTVEYHLKIVSINGKVVQTLAPGKNRLISGITWSAAHLPAGVYIAELAGDKKIFRKRLVHIR